MPPIFNQLLEGVYIRPKINFRFFMKNILCKSVFTAHKKKLNSSLVESFNLLYFFSEYSYTQMFPYEQSNLGVEFQ